jgi:hypothetical protein
MRGKEAFATSSKLQLRPGRTAGARFDQQSVTKCGLAVDFRFLLGDKEILIEPETAMWWKAPNHRQVDRTELQTLPEAMLPQWLSAPTSGGTPFVSPHAPDPFGRFKVPAREAVSLELEARESGLHREFGFDLCLRSQPLDQVTIAINDAFDQAASENREFAFRSELKAISDRAQTQIAATEASLVTTARKFRFANQILQDSTEHSQQLASQQIQFTSDIERLEIAIRDRSEKNLMLNRERQHLLVALDEARSSENELRISNHQNEVRMSSLRNDLRLQAIENQRSLEHANQKLRLARWFLLDSDECIESLQSRESLYQQEIDKLELLGRQNSDLIQESHRNEMHLQESVNQTKSAEIELRAEVSAIQFQLRNALDDHQWEIHDLQSDWSAETNLWRTESQALSDQLGQMAAQLLGFEELKARSCQQEQQLRALESQLADAQAREFAARLDAEDLHRQADLNWCKVEQRVVQSRRQRALRCTLASQKRKISPEVAVSLEPQEFTDCSLNVLATPQQIVDFRNGIRRQIEDGRKSQNDVQKRMLRIGETNLAAVEIRDLRQELSFQNQQSEHYQAESDRFQAQVIEMTATIRRLSEEYRALDESNAQASHESTLKQADFERLIARQESEILRFEHHVEILRELIRQGRRNARLKIRDLQQTITNLQQNQVRRAA